MGIGSKPLPNLANLLRDDIHKTHTIVSHAGQDFSRVADNFCNGVAALQRLRHEAVALEVVHTHASSEGFVNLVLVVAVFQGL